MLKQSLRILFPAALALFCWQCGQNPSATVTNATPPEKAVAVANVQRITHEEASDTLRVDSTVALKPLQFKQLNPADAKDVLTRSNIASLIVFDAPDNGFYGDNRYRIEFVITDMTQMPDNPLLYTVKGKNRYKKTISAFEGVLEVKKVAEFSDPNLKDDEEAGKKYALQGTFNFKEDPALPSSGQFAGDFSMEFYQPIAKEEAMELWFFSDNSPSEGSGYRFVGNWTSFKNPATQKPVIWARDLFRFANHILENFYYGERDVTINEKYRSLGWDSYWEGDEWWHDSPKESKEAK